MQVPFNSKMCGDANHHIGENGWFPSHPDCPNHKAGVPFSLNYSESTSNGQISCAGCFLHSTILQSMAVSCPHLHACSDCSICYSENNDRAGSVNHQGGSPPLFPCRTPPQTGISPPLFHRENNCSNNFSPRYLYGAHSQTSDDMAVPGRSPAHTEEQINFNAVHSKMKIDSSHLQVSSIIPSSYPRNSSHSPHQAFLSTAGPSPSIHINSGLSPTPSEAALDTAAKTLVTPKPQKHENRKRGANDVCDVCGDRASGYHYNALTCEGCKGFFRRSIQKKEPLLRCKYGGNCEMDTYTRRKCPECRLKKCKAVGMLEECLLTEIQCQSKRNRKRRLKKSSSPEATPKIEKQIEKEKLQTIPSTYQSNSNNENTKQHSGEEMQLLQCLTSAFTEYSTNPELVKGWNSYLGGVKTSVSPNLVELATSHVKLLVEFTKKLPGFTRMKAEDQIGLLKGSVVEIMLLRNSHSYNMKKGKVDLSSIIKDIEAHETQFQHMLNFFEKAGKLDLDDTEYGLLCSIVLFDCDHAITHDKARIDKYRDMYLAAMKTYSEGRKPKRVHVVAKILNLVTELRTLYTIHSRIVSNFRKKVELSPLLCEIWDLK